MQTFCGLEPPVYREAKRWEHRNERWVPPGETIRPEEFGVEVIREAVARSFVQTHHYSGSFPAARLSVGLYRKTGVHPARPVGVAVFSVPMQRAAIPRYTGFEAVEGVELGRFVCAPEVAYNGETWFLKRALAALSKEKGLHATGQTGVRAVISYADPLERRDASGLITKQAHAGQIYQAHNALFAGRAKPRWLWLNRNGQVVSERGLSKLRNLERGHGYVERALLACGAAPRRCGEHPADWLNRILRPPLFQRIRHPGNFVYCFGLGRTDAKRIAGHLPERQAYPRLDNERLLAA